ncbi:hypothetical protein K492DRAFT_178023 [Lichtheimia hyalospora FSU 10163]|nr:hypothetical protein K492DRAFT_178023 [Lichtheimia hyalospora FSU 10163]
MNALICIDLKAHIKTLAHLALLRLLTVWFRASNKVLMLVLCRAHCKFDDAIGKASNRVLYVGSCTTHLSGENAMVL